MGDGIKLPEIASRINAHLRRIEADSVLNPYRIFDKETRRWRIDPTNTGVREFFGAGAHVAGRYVKVRYVSYQGSTVLSKADALRYLEALDSGYNGKHFGLK